MKYGSVCSGIESATVAWHPLGWRAAFYAEIEPFPSAVLAHHYPQVENRGDITKFMEWPDAAIDVLVGGTPCQDFSIAGRRAGMDGARGNLTLTYLAIAERYRPRWLVFENVPGILSIDDGRAMGAFTRRLGQLGYGWAYRSLDAQYFNLAQRRQRVFVVGSIGGWASAAAVLFERASLSGNPPSSRQARKDVAGTITSSLARGSADEGERSTLIAGTLQCGSKSAGSATNQDAESGLLIAHSLRADGFDASEDGTGRGTPLVPVAFDCKASGRNGFGTGEIAPTLRAMGHKDSHSNAGGQIAVAFQERGRASGRELDVGGDIAYALTAPAGGGRSQERNILTPSMAVRRLTPRECERLMGFPDDYTFIPYRGKPAADGPRYKALGNSKAVPVVRWIGTRIQMVEQILRERAA